MVRWLVLCASTAGGVGSIPGWGTKAPVPCVCVCVRAQLCPTLCDPMDYSLPGSSVHGIFQARNTGVGCRFLLQGILPIQGSNLSVLCLLHW